MGRVGIEVLTDSSNVASAGQFRIRRGHGIETLRGEVVLVFKGERNCQGPIGNSFDLLPSDILTRQRTWLSSGGVPVREGKQQPLDSMKICLDESLQLSPHQPLCEPQCLAERDVVEAAFQGSGAGHPHAAAVGGLLAYAEIHLDRIVRFEQRQGPAGEQAHGPALGVAKRLFGRR